MTILSRTGRGAGLGGFQAIPTALRVVFTDLMAYALFFEATCAHECPSLTEVRDKVLALIDAQEERVKAGEVPEQAYHEARFPVLSWVDELILNSPWQHRGQWQHLMLTYYGTLNAGEQFFERLERLPSHANEIREIYYLCLCLGFQGKYALGENPNELRELRRTLYRQLAGVRYDVRQSYHRLFPEAYQKAPGKTPSPLPRVRPLWFGLALLLPVVLFVSYWVLLRTETNRLLALIEQRPIVGPVNGPPPPPPPPEWTRSLIEELRRRGIEAKETRRGVLIRLENLMFEVNSADLSPSAERITNDIAIAVEQRAPGRTVSVEGHASRERGVREDYNQRLSEDRANSVADSFLTYGLVSNRVRAQGFGTRQPVAPNDTEAGRRRNRRVEIIVER